MRRDEAGFSAEPLISYAVGLIADGRDYADFDARIALVAEHVMPPPPEGRLRDEPELNIRLARAIARGIWRNTPHPALGFALPTLRDPGRNDPCRCGSGRKYKQCCLEMDHGFPLSDLNLLSSVLECLPRKRWKELAGSKVALDRVAHVALEWRQANRSDDVRALLEPWFVDDRSFDARHEVLFDALVDAYTDLDRPRKKKTLLERGWQHGDRALRSTVLQRRVAMVADDGDFAGAWRLFEQARQHEPESPSLAHLEVTLLLSERRIADAQACARSWIARLSRRRDRELDILIDFLRDVAERGAEPFGEISAQLDPMFGGLLAQWRAAPPIACRYDLAPDANSAGPLKPGRALTKALGQWDIAFPDAGDPWDLAPVWIALLEEQPELWNSFEVLADVSLALDALPGAGTDEVIGDALLLRAEKLLREVLRTHSAENLQLEWGWHENRSALRLIDALIERSLHQPLDAAALARIEWLVDVLNPYDNQGRRFTLSRCYLEVGRFDAAVALAARYPDDFATTRYNRALALHALGRTGEATTALHDAATVFPKVISWLLAKDPKPPKRGGFGIEVGGDEEAFIYRSEHLALWQRLGALEWARGMAAAIKKK